MTAGFNEKFIEDFKDRLEKHYQGDPRVLSVGILKNDDDDYQVLVIVKDLNDLPGGDGLTSDAVAYDGIVVYAQRHTVTYPTVETTGFES